MSRAVRFLALGAPARAEAEMLTSIRKMVTRRAILEGWEGRDYLLRQTYYDTVT